MPDQNQNTSKESRFDDLKRRLTSQMTAESPEAPGAEPVAPREQAPEQAELAPEAQRTHPEERPVQETDQPSFQAPPAPSQPQPPTTKTPTRKRIESILSENVSELYASMDPVTRQAFRAEGIQVASRIEDMIAHAKVKAKVVIELIRAWLTMIPGINKFFLEQETKIKADKIAELVDTKIKRS